MFYRIGTAMYVVWGLLHLRAAYAVYTLAESIEPGMVRARVLQDAWHLLLFALLGIVTAIGWNWRNDRCGYWLNLIVIGLVDLGFVLLVVVPKLVPLWPHGLLGPLVYLLAALFTTIGILQNKPQLAGSGDKHDKTHNR